MTTVALSVSLFFSTACLPNLHFDTARVREVALGAEQEKVLSIVGEPQHMMKLMDHANGCTEGWSYVDIRQGIPPHIETFIVDFDGQGKVCDLHDVIRDDFPVMDPRLPPDPPLFQEASKSTPGSTSTSGGVAQ
jgi:hypothetical protein